MLILNPCYGVIVKVRLIHKINKGVGIYIASEEWTSINNKADIFDVFSQSIDFAIVE